MFLDAYVGQEKPSLGVPRDLATKAELMRAMGRQKACDVAEGAADAPARAEAKPLLDKLMRRSEILQDMVP